MNDLVLVTEATRYRRARELLNKAKAALPKAYAPYSKFAVAAAVRVADGKVYVGVNVENASYGLTICAERSAVFAAITQGARKINAVAIVSAAGGICLPCGACRQVISEFADAGTEFFFETSDGEPLQINLDGLLPHPFGPKHLEEAAARAT